MNALFQLIGLRGTILLLITIGAFAGIFYAFHVVEQRKIGRQQERTRIEQVNNANRDKADAAERNVLNCPPGKWNREASRCEP